MRGAFPGMGPILSAMNIADGNTIAWELQKYIMIKDGNLLSTDPWSIFEECLKEPQQYFNGSRAELFSPTAKRIWNSKPQKKRECFKLLSRLQLNNDQAKLLLSDQMTATVPEILENPYLIYEEIYEGCGLDKELAQQVALQLTRHNALETHARDELGISKITQARPMQAAFASAVSFIAGGVLPLLVSIFAPLQDMLISQYGFSIISLAISGAIAAKAGGSFVKKSILRICIWGTFAMAISGLVGHVFGV